MFLGKKLNSLRAQDKTQITMLSMWLIEIYLKLLGELRENDQDNSATYQHLQANFRQLLNKPVVKVRVCSTTSMSRCIVHI